MNLKRTLISAMLAVQLLTARVTAGDEFTEEGTKPPVAGKVIETTNSGNYTYVLVQHGAQKTWAASLQFEVAVGDSVSIPQGSVMKNFTSQTLEIGRAHV